MADSHSYVHPAVLEQQLADAKASAAANVIPVSQGQTGTSEAAPSASPDPAKSPATTPL